MSFSLVTVVLAAAITAGTPILYASLGELISERAGVLNLGLKPHPIFYSQMLTPFSPDAWQK